MKKTILTLFAAALATTAAFAQAPRNVPRLNYGVGPVIAASMDSTALPTEARNFLQKYFPGVSTVKVENDFKDRRYEVSLADGAEVDFDYNGNWIEIEAPDGATLPSSTLSALMPESVVATTISGDALTPGGASEYVEEVVTYPDFYVVQLRTPAGEKTRAAVAKTDGAVTKLKSKGMRPADKKGYKHGKKSDAKRQGKRRGGSAVPVRLDHSPKFYIE